MTRTLEIGSDGWVSVRLTDDLTVHAKAGRDATGGVIVTDLLISAPEITTDVLRQINPHRVLLAGAVSENVDGRALMAAFAGRDDSETTLADLRSRGARVRTRKRAPLGRPPSGDVDSFYGDFAKAYRSAALESSRPAMLLATENGVPVETVRRWTKEARRRGKLEPGRQGRSG